MTKEELADQLLAILFPPLEQDKQGFWTDHGVREIEGAIYDIERAQGQCDDVCLRTLKRVAEKLRHAEQVVEPYRAPGIPYAGELDPEVDDA